MRKIPIIIALLGVIAVTVWSSVFIVTETQQALVLQFGEVKREIRGLVQTSAEIQADTEAERVAPEEKLQDVSYERGPGLYFKLPIVQDVVFYDDRILALDTSPLEVTPIDDRRLVVDAFARWRIREPVKFRQAVQNEFAALQRLESVLNAALREVLGSVPSDAVLSAERTALMRRITDVAREQALALGVLIIDVRIKRADLPAENLEATYRRMNAEREREAADERARGQERAQEVRAQAERGAVELVSDAERQAEEIRGQADAERNRIYAEAFGRDPEFFAFFRSLKAYERSLQGQNSTLVISPNSEFFEYLKNDGSSRLPAALPGSSSSGTSSSGAAGSDGGSEAGDGAGGGSEDQSGSSTGEGSDEEASSGEGDVQVTVTTSSESGTSGASADASADTPDVVGSEATDIAETPVPGVESGAGEDGETEQAN